MIVLRPLRWRDFLWTKRLAADPDVRAASFDPRPPTWRGHWRYFTRMRRGGFEWVACLVPPEGDPVWRVGVATAHWDIAASPPGPYIGVSVAAKARGYHRGRKLIVLASQEIRRRWPRMLVYAAIKPDNEASLRAFTAAGYRELAVFATAQRRVFCYGGPSA